MSATATQVREATLCHLLRGIGDKQQVLLGLRSKTARVLPDKWLGPGGGLEESDGQDPHKFFRCLQREVREEVGIEIDLNFALRFADVTYYYPNSDGTGHYPAHRVHYFNVVRWEGEPQFSKELVKVDWFDLNQLPYDQMPVDMSVWFPQALRNQNGGVFKAHIYYADNTELTEVVDWHWRLITDLIELGT